MITISESLSKQLSKKAPLLETFFVALAILPSNISKLDPARIKIEAKNMNPDAYR